MQDDFEVKQLQDLGDAVVKVRRHDEVGASGVARLLPDDGMGHLDALEQIRQAIDEHYGERIEKLADDGYEVVIERAVFLSDDLPHIEYRIIEEREE